MMRVKLILHEFHRSLLETSFTFASFSSSSLALEKKIVWNLRIYGHEVSEELFIKLFFFFASRLKLLANVCRIDSKIFSFICIVTALFIRDSGLVVNFGLVFAVSFNIIIIYHTSGLRMRRQWSFRCENVGTVKFKIQK